MSPAPPVIIVLNYTTRDLIERCITSIKYSQKPGSYRLIVIDNGSKDDSPEFLSSRAWELLGVKPEPLEVPDVTLTANTKREREDKPGEWYKTTMEKTFKTVKAFRSDDVAIALLDQNYRWEGGVNYGIDLAEKLWPGSDFILLGSDAQLFRSTIEELQRAVELHPRIGLVSAKLVGKVGERLFVRFGGSRELAGKEHVVDWQDSPGDPDDPDNIHLFKEQRWLTGSCLYIRNQAFKDCGFLDMSFYIYAGDSSFCKTARQHNWACVYAPTAMAMHEDGRTVALVKRETSKEEWDRQQGYEMTHHHCLWMDEFVPYPLLPPGVFNDANTWPGR